ncbi:MAG: aminopeptidase P family protein [Planctomycetia bacterium]|nr:aminopeptidase P family protein [Planctomycetia bacterium]MBL6915362.1 aminopeptidase P family protein [Planctomycetota bacterium]HCW44909.1 aminopeptidase P family protein [Planctomycetota bacterium]
MHEKTAELIIDDSERESDLLWASGFLAVDQFTWLRDSRGSAIMLTDLELGRGEKESRVDEVISLSAVEKSAREVKGGEPCSFEEIVLQLLKSRNIERVEVPSRFPLMIADFLRSGGIEVVARENPFFSDRRIKRADEIRCLEESQAATEEAMALAIRLISNSEPGPDGVLQLDGEPLTSELIKYSVRSFLLSKGLQIGEFIIAPGDQGCDPHDVGSGPIRAGETVICDIYPQHMTHRFWGDMTRTVVKGQATEDQKKIHAAVLEAQETAISLIKPGACGQEIHRRVQQVFESAGFSTQQRDGTWEGFFHGTGHGLGLDIHEPPRISPVGPQLEEGMVVTVEPGLYYPGIGGCRIEDVVLVTADGCRNFNKAPKGLEV